MLCSQTLAYVLRWAGAPELQGVVLGGEHVEAAVALRADISGSPDLFSGCMLAPLTTQLVEEPCATHYR